jgi:hypothetical protein
MPQKGLKKVMGFGEAEKTFLKSFFRFPKYQLLFGTVRFQKNERIYHNEDHSCSG